MAATDGLETAVLDHAPRWEEARRQAFYDWLFRGGRLDIFKGIDGNFPRFTAQLAELNTPAEHFRVGRGEVFRHDKPLGPNDAALLEPPVGASDTQAADKKSPEKKHADKNKPDKLFNATTGKTARSGKKIAPANPEDDDDDESQVQMQVGPGGVTRSVTYGRGQIPDLFPDLSAGLLTFLKSLTRPRHNWVLIYSLAIAYVITVIPGVYVLGRNRYDYRIVYGALIGLIVLFSFGFAWFGRRGHNESNAVNTIAIARPLAGGAWDVSSWTNVFVINGADYQLVHGGSGRLYSTAQTFEAVNGVIRNGARGRFDVDIPPYSSQAFVSRMKVANDPLGVKLQEIAGDKQVTKLVLVDGPRLSPSGRHRGRLCRLRRPRLSAPLVDGAVRTRSLGRASCPPVARPRCRPLFDRASRSPSFWPPSNGTSSPLTGWATCGSRHSVARQTSPRPTSRSTRRSFGRSWPGASVSRSATTSRPSGFPTRRSASFSGGRFPKASNSSGLTWANSRDAFCTCSTFPNR